MQINKNPPIIITPFHRKYQTAVRKLINKGLGEHWGVVDQTRNPDLDDIANAYKDADFFVASKGEKIVGTGALIHSTDQVAEIVRMSVDFQYRRMGIGHSILNHLVCTAKSKGYKKIILETTETWREVIKFYEAYGFQITHWTNGDCYLELVIKY